ncbi:MAG: MBL fold metallo-hydrolase [Alphaproteobacteria bacterium]|nr:MBL fold metallo-hydrolase [Alphaproteobacteria bacterium]
MIEYPFGAIPGPGDVHPVAPGIFWLRMPLPFRLNHINLWLLEDGDGWTLVDTGMAMEAARDAWHRIIDEHLGGQPIKRIIVTHFHSDHAGLAGWLTDRFGSQLWMSNLEWRRTRLLAGGPDPAWSNDVFSYFHQAGCPEAMITETHSLWSGYNSRMSPTPDLHTTLSDGMTFDIGGRSWRVLIGRGHAPEHVSLYSEDLDVLIAGDQVLPRISPNVSLFPGDGGDNPLGDFLVTTESFRAQLPDTALVLPSHNEPFYGLHYRLDQLASHHDERLDQMADLCGEPSTGYGVSRQSFSPDLDGLQASLALTETMAHLNHLICLGRINRQTRNDGVWLHACA